MWVLQHHLVHAFDISTFIVFVYLGWQFKWNQLSLSNPHHTSCMHKGLHAGEWSEPMTSKPDSVSTLGYHWTDQAGRPLEPQVHWDVTGTTLADVSKQWFPSGDPVLICIIGTHWKTTRPTIRWDTTGTTLADARSHWYPSGDSVLICIIGTHWSTTGRPLEEHWKHTGNALATNISFSSGIPVYTGV